MPVLDLQWGGPHPIIIIPLVVGAVILRRLVYRCASREANSASYRSLYGGETWHKPASLRQRHLGCDVNLLPTTLLVVARIFIQCKECSVSEGW
jgi:hypothetical protein